MFRQTDSVLVIGVGRSGMATAHALRARGVAVAAFDDKDRARLETEIEALARIGVAVAGPAELESAARAATAAVLSPGVPSTHAAVRLLQRLGTPVYAEIEVAYALSAAPIIAITGSKGKSTTTALVGHLLRHAGLRARVGGNIGNPLIGETVAARPDEWIIAEVSSFQLENIARFKPRVSVLLNVTADHLDRYSSMDAYAAAKYRIFANQGPDDAFVGNADDAYCARLRASGHAPPARRLWFSAAGDPEADAALEDGTIVLRATQGRARIVLAQPGDLQLRGAHNLDNAMAASLAALVAGADAASLREGLRTFAPLPHRLQTVASGDGVDWVDDSKATNPDAVVKALEALDAPVVLIAGGKSKNTDFAALGAAASRRAKTVVLIGEAAAEIGAHVSGIPVVHASSLDEAVDAAARASAPGDVVLLSPGCASFDMFDSAEQRGDLFAALARRRARKVAAR